MAGDDYEGPLVFDDDHYEEESMPVCDIDIEDVIEEEEGFVGKRGFGGEEDNIKDLEDCFWYSGESTDSIFVISSSHCISWYQEPKFLIKMFPRRSIGEESEYLFFEGDDSSSDEWRDYSMADAIEEEEGFVGKRGFGGEEDNIEDVIVVANDLCFLMIQTSINADFFKNSRFKPSLVIRLQKDSIIVIFSSHCNSWYQEPKFLIKMFPKRSIGEESEYLFFQGDDSSFDEWRDYSMAGDDYEGPSVFDDDHYGEESMPVCDIDIEDVIEEEGFVEKRGFGGEEDNIEDVIVEANDLCFLMFQTSINVDFSKAVYSNPHYLFGCKKSLPDYRYYFESTIAGRLFLGNDSSSDEWRDYSMARDDYEGPTVFDDDHYEEELMLVCDIDIEDVIEEEEGFVGKRGFGGEEDNIEDVIVVANDLYSLNNRYSFESTIVRVCLIIGIILNQRLLKDCFWYSGESTDSIFVISSSHCISWYQEPKFLIKMFPWRSIGEESAYLFFEGNDSSSDEWRDYSMAGDDYEGPSVFDDDHYEEESMPVCDIDIEDDIEEEEGFVGKRGFGGEEDNIEDVIVVANNLCFLMIQTSINVDFSKTVDSNPSLVIRMQKGNLVEINILIGKKYQGMAGDDYEGPSVFDDDHYEEESMPVCDIDIEDVIEEEEGFVGKSDFGGDEDNIKDVIVVANDLCFLMIQTSINVDFSKTVDSNPHYLFGCKKLEDCFWYSGESTDSIFVISSSHCICWYQEPKFLIKMFPRRSIGEESAYLFFEGDDSSSDEWRDYSMAGDDYEGPLVFDDDHYEEESMPVCDFDIEDVIEEEEGFVRKRGFGGEEDNIEDVIVGDDSSFYEWRDYNMAGDDYEGPSVFDDDHYEEESMPLDDSFWYSGESTDSIFVISSSHCISWYQEPKFLVKMFTRRSKGEESEYMFFEGDDSSSDEWRDYSMAGDDYEGPSVFDDDHYKEESMPVCDIDIEDVIEEEEGFVGKTYFGGEEDNIKDVIVVANDLCYLMIQTSINVDFSKTVDSNPHYLFGCKKIVSGIRVNQQTQFLLSLLLTASVGPPIFDDDHYEEESMPVCDIDIEDVIEEEEGFVKKRGFGGEEDNIKDIIVVANDLCFLMIQTSINVDFSKAVYSNPHYLFGCKKLEDCFWYSGESTDSIFVISSSHCISWYQEPKFLIKTFPRRSEGKESEYPFFEGDYSSFDERRDYSMVGDDYEGPPVFDDDHYEEESMPVCDIDIEDVIDEEEGFVGKRGFGGEEDNIEDIIVVANDLCYLMIQTSINVDFSKTVDSNPH
uniref:Uncharacterized protein n=1 Tax=Tanacetum cinerariifolium TaxID=118510 RepID=A0A6L2KBM1_TANCI|nr:hypothetical protein [Tanacetum cinerariifolium]